MRFIVFVPASKESEKGIMPPKALFEAMGKFNEEMMKAGVMLAGEGLTPSSKGARIKFSNGGKPQVTDGPFTESKELVAGFWIIQAKSKEEAIEWMKRAPFGEGAELEIRPIMELADFPPDTLPAGMAERERAMRDALAKKASHG